ncbi:MAG: ABC transporter substrate-binding protein [Jatrophihabitantaceae bacterium]
MSTRKRGRITIGCTAAACAVATALAACSTPSTGGTTSSPTGTVTVPTAQPNTSAVAAVPAAIRAKGTLTVGTSADYAPIGFVAADGRTIIGSDADLATAIGQELGLKVRMVNATFDALIPGLAAHRYDLVMAGMNDRREREKTVDFVDYFSAGTSFFERSTGGPAVRTLADLCGHSVAVESGTSEETDANAQNTTCRKTGEAGLKVLVFQDQNAANLALSSSRADVGMADSPVAGYIVAQGKGQFKLVGQAYGTVPDGIALPKGSPLVPAIQKAVNALIADGTYTAILTKWGTKAGAVTSAQVNGATS